VRKITLVAEATFNRIEHALGALLGVNLIERQPKSSHTPERWITKTT